MIWWLLVYSALAEDKCYLLGDREPEKPSPSLVKCYRQNANACCVSGHDQHIKDSYEDFMSVQCQREYRTMEDYFCFGCFPDTRKYIDPENKEIRLCKSFIEDVWGNDIDKRSTEYDNCGMNTYWRDDPTYIMPSVEWENATEFFKECKPPLFENYTIVISEDDCYNDGYIMILSCLILLILL